MLQNTKTPPRDSGGAYVALGYYPVLDELVARNGMEAQNEAWLQGQEPKMIIEILAPNINPTTAREAVHDRI